MADRPKRNASKPVDPDFVTFAFGIQRSPGSSGTKKHAKLSPEPQPTQSICRDDQGKKRKRLSFAPSDESLAKKNKKETSQKPDENKTPEKQLNVAKSEEKHSHKKKKEHRDKEKSSKKQTSPKNKQTKRKSTSTHYSPTKPGKTGCNNPMCVDTRPICFVGSDKCTKMGYTPRWYHLSIGEHFCNQCFEEYYRPRRAGNVEFLAWKDLWRGSGTGEPGVRIFIGHRFLPYWIRCQWCGKFRQISRNKQITAQFLEDFNCDVDQPRGLKGKPGEACEWVEDDRVQQMKNGPFPRLTNLNPCLMHSPAAPFLVNYYPDKLGLCPITHRPSSTTCNGTQVKDDDSDADSSAENEEHKKGDTHIAGSSDVPNVPGLPEHFIPFQQPNDTYHALSVSPSAMSKDEQAAFPEYTRDWPSFLGLRNLVIAVWNLNCQKVLTTLDCEKHLICRGLLRVRLVQDLDRVIHYLTVQGLVNIGVIPHPKTGLLPSYYNQVTILEASDYIGGRVKDDHSLGVCVGLGAQMINGCTNNPFTVLAKQTNTVLWQLSEGCDLIEETGKVIDFDTDKRLDFHFNAVIDNVTEWRNSKHPTKDVPLLEKIKENHRHFAKESPLAFTEQEERLLQFHLSNLEFALGSRLEEVSALHWDQNEAWPQFDGPHCLVSKGYGHLLKALTTNLNIELGKQVVSVEVGSDGVRIVTSAGEEIQAARVIVSVPLSVLSAKSITFTPQLPLNKRQAIQNLGKGQLEKVALLFSRRFWTRKMNGADCFGHVPSSADERGQFSIFCDLSPKTGKYDVSSPGVLVTYLSGAATRLVKRCEDEKQETKNDARVAAMCVATLRKLFPEENVPEPDRYVVTRWKHKPLAGMAYSYLPVGTSGQLYDVMAAPVGDRLFFAGEATNRQYPQSVTGAYLSGIREATRILQLSLCIAKDKGLDSSLPLTFTPVKINKSNLSNKKFKTPVQKEAENQASKSVVKSEVISYEDFKMKSESYAAVENGKVVGKTKEHTNMLESKKTEHNTHSDSGHNKHTKGKHSHTGKHKSSSHTKDSEDREQKRRSGSDIVKKNKDISDASSPSRSSKHKNSSEKCNDSSKHKSTKPSDDNVKAVKNCDAVEKSLSEERHTSHKKKLRHGDSKVKSVNSGSGLHKHDKGDKHAKKRKSDPAFDGPSKGGSSSKNSGNGKDENCKTKKCSDVKNSVNSQPQSVLENNIDSNKVVEAGDIDDSMKTEISKFDKNVSNDIDADIGLTEPGEVTVLFGASPSDKGEVGVTMECAKMIKRDSKWSNSDKNTSNCVSSENEIVTVNREEDRIEAEECVVNRIDIEMKESDDNDVESENTPDVRKNQEVDPDTGMKTVQCLKKSLENGMDTDGVEEKESDSIVVSPVKPTSDVVTDSNSLMGGCKDDSEHTDSCRNVVNSEGQEEVCNDSSDSKSNVSDLSPQNRNTGEQAEECRNKASEQSEECVNKASEQAEQCVSKASEQAEEFGSKAGKQALECVRTCNDNVKLETVNSKPTSVEILKGNGDSLDVQDKLISDSSPCPGGDESHRNKDNDKVEC